MPHGSIRLADAAVGLHDEVEVELALDAMVQRHLRVAHCAVEVGVQGLHAAGELGLIFMDAIGTLVLDLCVFVYYQFFVLCVYYFATRCLRTAAKGEEQQGGEEEK